jgi:hypothetical protein
VVVEEGQSDQVVGVVVYAARLVIMQEPVRRVFRPLRINIVIDFN